MHITESEALWTLADSVTESLMLRIAAGDLAVTPSTPSPMDDLGVGLAYFFAEVESRVGQRLGGAR